MMWGCGCVQMSVFSGREQSWQLVRRSEMLGCRIWHLLTLFRGIDVASSQVLGVCLRTPRNDTGVHVHMDAFFGFHLCWAGFAYSISHILQTSLFYCNCYFVCIRHAVFIFLPLLSTVKHFHYMLLKISAVSLPKKLRLLLVGKYCFFPFYFWIKLTEWMFLTQYQFYLEFELQQGCFCTIYHADLRRG